MISDERIKELAAYHFGTFIPPKTLVANFARAIEAECRVPEGWVLVPVEPTPEMLAAGVNRHNAYKVDHGSAMFYAYAAMLDAAPQPEKAECQKVEAVQQCKVCGSTDPVHHFYHEPVEVVQPVAPQPEKAEPDVPFPGMQEAFEAHYSQSFTDRDWRREAGVWAAAWKAATRYAECQKAEPVAQEPVAWMHWYKYYDGTDVVKVAIGHAPTFNDQSPFRSEPLYAAPVVQPGMVKDAERYRWLRDESQVSDWEKLNEAPYPNWDDIIDAMIAAAEGKE